jgi:F-box-like
LSSVSDRDPNAQKNRIPTEAELAGLQLLKGMHSRFAYQLEEEITSTQTTQRRLLARYEQQLRELEGIQSQLHETKKTLQVLQEQYLVHQAEVERLSGITHPIRRYPSDVLQYIFEHVFDVAKEDLKMEAVLALSHVCQRWRSIAIDTPRLWCTIDFTLDKDDEEENMAFFWDSMIPRIKSAPAFITIRGYNETTASMFGECKLMLIPNISSLALELDTLYNISDVLPNPGLLPGTGVGSLSITYATDIEDESAQQLTWDAGETLEKLPPVPDLFLTAPCALRVTPSVKFETLTQLSFRDLQGVDVLAILSLCAQLSYLRLSDVTFPEPTPAHITSQSLQTLIVNTLDGNEWWLQQMSCPNLIAFHHGSDFLESSMSIFESYGSLLTLEYTSQEQLLPRFATATPLIQSLVIEPSELRILCDLQANGTESPPFPCLKELTVSLINAELTLEVFESIVRTRCLPTSHPHSQLPPSLAPLSHLSLLGWRKDSPNQYSDSWRSNALYKEAKSLLTDDKIWKYYKRYELSWI